DGVRRKLEQTVAGAVAIGGLFGNHGRENGGGDVGRPGQVWRWVPGRRLLCRGGRGKKREHAQSRQHSHVSLLLTFDSTSEARVAVSAQLGARWCPIRGDVAFLNVRVTCAVSQIDQNSGHR